MNNRSGFIAICGQPNVGKSTLLNGFLKEKLAIVSRKPETTRDIMRGILTEKDYQMIFVDTPGIHKPHDLLGKLMLSRAQSSLLESEIILFVTEKKAAFNRDDENILKRLPLPKNDKKVIFILNKVDKIKDKTSILPLLERASTEYPFDEIVPISAFNEKDLEKLLKIIRTYLPEGPQLYPEEQLSDRGMRFFVAEIIREKVLLNTHKEVPHSVAVVVDDINSENDKGPVKIQATVYVERTSQKSILIGKNGQAIKRIRQVARKDIEKMLEKKTYLDLWVKVSEKWKTDPNALQEMGYTD